MKRIMLAMAAIMAALLSGAGLSAPAAADNPFGVMFWPAGQNPTILMARARGLGVGWYRPPALFVDGWIDRCDADCQTYRSSGLMLAVTVRNARPRGVGRPPADFDSYRAALRSIAAAWRPSAIIVESSEDDDYFYQDSYPDFQGYREQLGAACDVARKEGAACLNGGLSFEGAVTARWFDLLQNNQPEACAFARRALLDERGDEINAAALCAIPTAAAARQRFSERLHRLDALLAIYRDAPIDAVNFQWYGRSARALGEVAGFLAARTGKRVASSEIGQRPWSAYPADVKPLLRAVFASDLRLAIWYSIDSGQSAALFEADGRLRPTGWEFQNQLMGRKGR